MGYYTREDLPFFHALADNFTICDRYFCSVIGPTDPNRLYTMSATIDPEGKNGGPSLQTLVTNREQQFGKFTWTTYPEQLQSAGISWKIYSTPDGDYGDNVLPYFKAYQENPQLAANAFTPTVPDRLPARLRRGHAAAGLLGARLARGQRAPARPGHLRRGRPRRSRWTRSRPTRRCGPRRRCSPPTTRTVASSTTCRRRLRLPAPRASTSPSNRCRASPAASAGPIGLGFRVPMLVISPFSRGGFVCSRTFDHTSLLRFLERRFGPEVPNLSKWRRSRPAT